jgi:hypothetical protein
MLSAHRLTPTADFGETGVGASVGVLGWFNGRFIPVLSTCRIHERDS